MYSNLSKHSENSLVIVGVIFRCLTTAIVLPLPVSVFRGTAVFSKRRGAQTPGAELKVRLRRLHVTRAGNPRGVESLGCPVTQSPLLRCCFLFGSDGLGGNPANLSAMASHSTLNCSRYAMKKR